eukprot:COSAG02_NODE_26260_length_637_cov_0.763941_1_plen_37_part_10
MSTKGPVLRGTPPTLARNEPWCDLGSQKELPNYDRLF